MKIKKGFVIRQVGDSFVAVPVGEMSKKFRGMINLNATGAFLWNFFTSEHTVDEGVSALTAEYEVADEIARADVERFVAMMLQHGLAD